MCWPSSAVSTRIATIGDCTESALLVRYFFFGFSYVYRFLSFPFSLLCWISSSAFIWSILFSLCFQLGSLRNGRNQSWLLLFLLFSFVPCLFSPSSVLHFVVLFAWLFCHSIFCLFLFISCWTARFYSQQSEAELTLLNELKEVEIKTEERAKENPNRQRRHQKVRWGEERRKLRKRRKTRNRRKREGGGKKRNREPPFVSLHSFFVPMRVQNCSKTTI